MKNEIAILTSLTLVALGGLSTAGEPIELPKKCAADSPVDLPCTSYAGAYKIRLRPKPAARPCVLVKPVEGKVVLSDQPYKGMEQAKAELAGLAKKLGMKEARLRVGAAKRAGVCCIDLQLSDDARGTVRIHMARGKTKVSAKANDRWVRDDGMCGDVKLDVSVELAGQ